MPPPLPDSPARPLAPIGLLAALTVALHLAVAFATPYGIHRDEFLYFALGQHLRFWAMDVPPGIGVLASGARAVFGDTLWAARFWPALCHAALVALSMGAAQMLGGSRRALVLAGLATGLGVLFLRAGTLFQPVVFDQVCWTVGLVALVGIGQTGRRAWWMVLGVAGGLGLLVKLSILFFGLAVLVGLALSPQRRVLLTPLPYAAALVALVLGSPTLVGQIRLGFPVVGQMAALHQQQLERVTPGAFLAGQLEMLGPALVLALAGIAFLLAARATRPARAAGWTSLVAFALMLATQGKAYYIGPIYPFLFGAGAVALEALPRRVFRPAYAVLVVLVGGAGVLAFPAGVPILPPAAMARYTVRIEGGAETNTGEAIALPQDYADMLGWQARVQAVARAYHALSDADRAAAVVLAANYGEAGALDFYGPALGLPPAVCAHTSYWFFGPGDRPGRVAVGLGLDEKDLAPFYDSVAVVAVVDEPWGVPEERHAPIALARAPRYTLQQVWPTLAGQY